MNLIFLSKYRTQLMGIAIMWVIIYHAAIDFHISILNFIGNQGYLGVDIFILLSGLGLYFSLSKKPLIKQFYFNRFIRIFPYYIVAILIYSYINNYTKLDVILNLTTISYWINWKNKFDWYIPAITIFYLVFPLYLHFFKKYPFLISSITIIGGIVLSLLLPLNLYNFTTRIPIFAIGILIGYMIYNNLGIKNKYLILLIIASIIGIIIFYLNIRLWQIPQLNILSLMITIPITSIILASLIQITKYNTTLTFLGNYSLTLYLFYDIIADYSIRVDKALYKVSSLESYSRWISEFIVLIIACLFAYIIHQVINLIIIKTLPNTKYA